MLSIYILFLGLVSSVTMETCPEPENIYPCVCTKSSHKLAKQITVECNGYSRTAMPIKLVHNALNGLRGKKDVELQLYNITDSLPSNMFSGIGITILRLMYCRIDSLTNDDQPGLLGLENHLKELEIHDGDLSQKKLQLGHLNKLYTLTLAGNNIPGVEDDWLSDVPQTLKELYISEKDIQKIGSHAFSRLNRLRRLSLNGNLFGPVKRSMFPDNLLSLHLTDNALADLPVDLFSRMPRIQHVALVANRLTTLDEQTWSPIWQQLDILDLEENDIVCDDDLNWIRKSSRMPRRITGECSAPEELKDMELTDFFRGKSH